MGDNNVLHLSARTVSDWISKYERMIICLSQWLQNRSEIENEGSRKMVNWPSKNAPKVYELQSEFCEIMPMEFFESWENFVICTQSLTTLPHQLKDMFSCYGNFAKSMANHSSQKVPEKRIEVKLSEVTVGTSVLFRLIQEYRDIQETHTQLIDSTNKARKKYLMARDKLSQAQAWRNLHGGPRFRETKATNSEQLKHSKYKALARKEKKARPSFIENLDCQKSIIYEEMVNKVVTMVDFSLGLFRNFLQSSPESSSGSGVFRNLCSSQDKLKIVDGAATVAQWTQKHTSKLVFPPELHMDGPDADFSFADVIPDGPDFTKRQIYNTFCVERSRDLTVEDYLGPGADATYCPSGTPINSCPSLEESLNTNRSHGDLPEPDGESCDGDCESVISEADFLIRGCPTTQQTGGRVRFNDTGQNKTNKERSYTHINSCGVHIGRDAAGNFELEPNDKPIEGANFEIYNSAEPDEESQQIETEPANRLRQCSSLKQSSKVSHQFKSSSVTVSDQSEATIHSIELDAEVDILHSRYRTNKLQSRNGGSDVPRKAWSFDFDGGRVSDYKSREATRIETFVSYESSDDDKTSRPRKNRSLLSKMATFNLNYFKRK